MRKDMGARGFQYTGFRYPAAALEEARDDAVF
jgi:hypothetical protein